MKPRLFIGSSSESEKLAKAAQYNLHHHAEVTVWSQGIFNLSSSNIESLIQALNNFDFGLFVFSPDDITIIRQDKYKSVRDNIIFELGLFIGRLNRERNFILVPTGNNLRLPTDLLGIIPAEYELNRSDGNIRAALGPPCYLIQEAIEKLGPLKSTNITMHKKETMSAKDNVFYDNFEKFIGWENYGKGKVVQSSDFSHTGKYSLKKDEANDPDGGYKTFDREIGSGFVFSGWVYRPSEYKGGAWDRLAIENSHCDGYGFTVAHNRKTIWIERRVKGISNPKSNTISDVVPFKLPMDQWYEFKFFIKKEGKLELKIFNTSGVEVIKIKDVCDNTYNSFDRVVIHGGFSYYVDELKIEIL